MREKDFRKYSQIRKGLMPRALMLNNAEWIVDELIAHECSRPLKFVEIGFNHGNDTRYLAEILYRRLGNEGWSFEAYDYEKYFMPENIAMDEREFPGINSQIRAIPCTLEGISANPKFFSGPIDLLYSSKTLTLCNTDVFYKVMSLICENIAENGYIACSLHTKVDVSDSFPTYSELFDMISGKNNICSDLFCKFSILVQPNVEECNFAFIAKKTGTHKVEVCSRFFENDCQKEYVKRAKIEKDNIFIQ